MEHFQKILGVIMFPSVCVVIIKKIKNILIKNFEKIYLFYYSARGISLKLKHIYIFILYNHIYICVCVTTCSIYNTSIFGFMAAAMYVCCIEYRPLLQGVPEVADTFHLLIKRKL